MKKREVVIIGCAGTARNVIEQILDAELNHHAGIHLVGICIDTPETGSKIAGIPVIAKTSEIGNIVKETDYSFLFALFKPEKLAERLHLAKSYPVPINRWTNFIHPLAWIADSTTIGYGNIVLSNSGLMSDVTLGNFNMINAGVIIEHETKIGDGNFLAAGCTIGAEVKMNNANFLGLNSVVREKVNLGNSVYAGMGSLILNDFDRVLIFGQPASKQKPWS